MEENDTNGVDDDTLRCKQQVRVDKQLKLMMRCLRVNHAATGPVDAGLIVRLVVRHGSLHIVLFHTRKTKGQNNNTQKQQRTNVRE